ncbi:maleylpyruvate isomerase family mycothiol-dependent enzyme [Prauserella sp. ASG 168]|uniref:Maleylpyruvate isomerase family mycothiol-dependent enzyme n=1 Tax=Prauserella cavernicola TaxID=2800127 RepID=A0A934V3D7_9PSEU|nr:maleylpyruvate isomerase family mycothiol-dependent enzyme [Prauserella cavernicola]
METHSDGLRTAAVAAGPDAPVPTCPKWTTKRLVRHIARVHSWVAAALTDPSGEHVRAGTPPEDWAALLTWWDERRDDLRAAFDVAPDSPAWQAFPVLEPVAASWARRQAHEAAIHRVDAELAAGADTVAFAADFAADGIDELLTMLVLRRGDWSGFTARGCVQVHAEDAGRLWSVWLVPGEAPQLGEEPVEPALTVEGTADAVYRTLWRRPGAARVTGDVALLEPLTPP